MDIELGDDHPLVLELTSLRNTATRFQHEAHIAAVKLQRHSLDTSHTLERLQVLERENVHLKQEVTMLRAHPDISPHSASLHVQELTLALRRVSDKLDLSEHALLTRTNELANSRSELVKANHDVEGAFALAAQMRAKEEESRARERELELRVRVAEEERKMSDLVVQEYADLVRSLEGRPSSSSVSSPHTNASARASSLNATLVDSLHEGKSGLQKLLTEFNGETERLQEVINQLHGQISVLEAQLESERKVSHHDRSSVSQAQTELDKARRDDNTAAKMVSRYMKFSQSSTDALQKAMEALRTRHGVTVNTLNARIDQLEQALGTERRQAGRLRDALDELSYEIAREMYGRRREISLRLALLTREESVTESLRRWALKAKESLERSRQSQDSATAARSFERLVRDVQSLLDSVLDGVSASHGDCSAGALGRLIAAQDAVSTLTGELQEETEIRMELEKQILQLLLVTPSTSPPLASPRTSTLTESEMKSSSSTLINPNLVSGHDSVPSPSPQTTNLTEEHTTDTDHIEEQGKIGRPIDLPDGKLFALNFSPVPVQEPVSSVTTTNTHLVNDLMNLPPPNTPTFVQHIPTLVTQPQPTTKTSTGLTETTGVDSDIFLGPLTPKSHQAPVLIHNEFVHSEALSVIDITGDAPSPTSLLSLSPQTWKEESNSGHASADPVDDEATNILSSLPEVKKRYDTLQHAFRDCHFALEDLKYTLSSLGESSTDSHTSSMLRRVIERLDDFNEDARVELEIRIADEELALKGFETLLAVPGAIADDVERAKIEENITAFVDGTDTAVDRAMHKFSRKLDDIQHDIAAVKRAVHELPIVDSMLDPAVAAENATTHSNWSSWTAGLLGAGTPRPSSPAPTFGSVMTTPRLRHSPSFTRQQTSDSSNTLANLGLRIAMPSFTAPAVPLSSPGLGINLTPTKVENRPRILSGMYMLGLGSRSASFAASPSPASHSSPTSRRPSAFHQAAGSPVESVGNSSESDSELDEQSEVE